MTRLLGLTESGGFRARFTGHRDCELHTINPCGGIAGGDQVSIEVMADPGARLRVTSAAPERLYRAADDLVARVDVTLRAAKESQIEWLPQETLIYEGARCARRLDVEAAEDARVLMAEMLVFGRRAHGERLRSAVLADRWRIRVGQRLRFAEQFRLAGDLRSVLAEPAIAAGAGAAALFLYVTRNAEERLAWSRGALVTSAAVQAAASGLPDVLVVRWLAQDAEALAAAVQEFVERFRGQALPRSWSRGASCN